MTVFWYTVAGASWSICSEIQFRLGSSILKMHDQLVACLLLVQDGLQTELPMPIFQNKANQLMLDFLAGVFAI